MSLPLTSVIMPCHNAARTLAESVGSALAQTAPIELIVVNDGSQDGSREILRSLEGRGVRVIDQPNRGASAARNAGVAVARGAFLQFLDADDLLSPDKIAIQVERLAGRPDAVASCAWVRFTTDSSRVAAPPRPVYRDFTPMDFLILAATTDAVMHPGAWLVPRAVAARAGPWDESLSLADDTEYFARAVLASSGIVFCPGPRSFYRSYDLGSLSHRRDTAACRSRFRVAELIAGHLLRAEDSPRTRRAAAALYISFMRRMPLGSPDLLRRAAATAIQLDPRLRVPGRAERLLDGARMALRRLRVRLLRRLRSR